MKRRKNVLCVAILISAILSVLPLNASADYYLNSMYDGTTVNAGYDTGYSKSNPIKKGDVHFGWQLGQFTLTGYTDVTTEDGIPVFLVNPGDGITLGYSLKQDIDCLNGNDKLKICDDKNGWDNAYQVEQTDFGRGALLVKYADRRRPV